MSMNLFTVETDNPLMIFDKIECDCHLKNVDGLFKLEIIFIFELGGRGQLLKEFLMCWKGKEKSIPLKIYTNTVGISGDFYIFAHDDGVRACTAYSAKNPITIVFGDDGG